MITQIIYNFQTSTFAWGIIRLSYDILIGVFHIAYLDWFLLFCYETWDDGSIVNEDDSNQS